MRRDGDRIDLVTCMVELMSRVTRWSDTNEASDNIANSRHGPIAAILQPQNSYGKLHNGDNATFEFLITMKSSGAV